MQRIPMMRVRRFVQWVVSMLAQSEQRSARIGHIILVKNHLRQQVPQQKLSLVHGDFDDLSRIKRVQNIIFTAEVNINLLIIRIFSKIELVPQKIESLVRCQWLYPLVECFFIKVTFFLLRQILFLLKKLHGRSPHLLRRRHYLLKLTFIRTLKQCLRILRQQLLHLIIYLHALGFQIA